MGGLILMPKVGGEAGEMKEGPSDIHVNREWLGDVGDMKPSYQ